MFTAWLALKEAVIGWLKIDSASPTAERYGVSAGSFPEGSRDSWRCWGHWAYFSSGHSGGFYQFFPDAHPLCDISAGLGTAQVLDVSFPQVPGGRFFLTEVVQAEGRRHCAWQALGRHRSAVDRPGREDARGVERCVCACSCKRGGDV